MFFVRVSVNLSTEAVLEIFAAFQKTLESRFSQTVGKMNSYLGDRKTEQILIKVIKSHILGTYQSFFDLISANYEFSVTSEIWTIKRLSDLMTQLHEDVGIIIE